MKIGDRIEITSLQPFFTYLDDFGRNCRFYHEPDIVGLTGTIVAFEPDEDRQLIIDLGKIQSHAKMPHKRCTIHPSCVSPQENAPSEFCHAADCLGCLEDDSPCIQARLYRKAGSPKAYWEGKIKAIKEELREAQDMLQRHTQ